MLLEEDEASTADDATQDEPYEDRVVELAGDGNEVRHEVERQEQVRDERAE